MDCQPLPTKIAIKEERFSKTPINILNPYGLALWRKHANIGFCVYNFVMINLFYNTTQFTHILLTQKNRQFICI